MSNVSQDLCDEKAKVYGRSLGGANYFAVYTIPVDEWDWKETKIVPDEEMLNEIKEANDARDKAEQEKKQATPWLYTPEVVELQQRLETLKELRRGANANFDLELSGKRTKEIN